MAHDRLCFSRAGAVPAAALLVLLCSGLLPAQDSRAGQSDTAEAAGNEADANPATDEETLARVVEQSVAMRVRPLARELKEFKEEVRFRDVLGGIGYIVGLAGLAFYFLGVRRRDRDKMRPGDPGRR